MLFTPASLITNSRNVAKENADKSSSCYVTTLVTTYPLYTIFFWTSFIRFIEEVTVIRIYETISCF